MSALLGNQGWIPDDSLKALVLKHCIGEPVCLQAKTLAAEGHSVRVTSSPRASDSYNIGPFETTTMEFMEAKIDQFPKGTTFTLNHNFASSQSDQDKLEASLPDVFAKHGMKLESAAPK